MGLHGSGGDAERVGDLRLGEVEVVAERQHLALARRQRAERGQDPIVVARGGRVPRAPPSATPPPGGGGARPRGGGGGTGRRSARRSAGRRAAGRRCRGSVGGATPSRRRPARSPRTARRRRPAATRAARATGSARGSAAARSARAGASEGSSCAGAIAAIITATDAQTGDRVDTPWLSHPRPYGRGAWVPLPRCRCRRASSRCRALLGYDDDVREAVIGLKNRDERARVTRAGRRPGARSCPTSPASSSPGRPPAAAAGGSAASTRRSCSLGPSPGAAGCRSRRCSAGAPVPPQAGRGRRRSMAATRGSRRRGACHRAGPADRRRGHHRRHPLGGRRRPPAARRARGPRPGRRPRAGPSTPAGQV